jgi:hypothetical protein
LKIIATIILYLYCIVAVLGQTTFEFLGVVKDSTTKERLVSASVFILPMQTGLSTDQQGKFKMDLPKGTYSIQISFLGYNTLRKEIEVSTNAVSKTFLLAEKSIAVENVNISAKKSDENIRSIEAGTLILETKDITGLPSLMGEPDIINALRLTPGVQGGGEGNPGLYVRGGDAGQNLILLDNMTLYNPSHLLGFFPVFNADIINDATIIKGGIPAQYGGRASSVIDVSMKEANTSQLKISGSMGILSTDLAIESPINKGEGSIIISGRRTYLNAVKFMAKPFIKSANSFFSNTDYYFYDASIKLRYNISPKTRIFVTAFGGKDAYNLMDNEYNVSNRMQWLNGAGAVRLNHTFSKKLIANLATSKTLFYYNIDASFNTYGFNLYSAIDDWKYTLDFTYLGDGNGLLKFGVSHTKHLLTPNKLDVDAGEIAYKNTSQYHSNEYSAYLNGTKKLTESFTISGGLRSTYYQHKGPYTHYVRNAKGQLSDSTIYNAEEVVESYLKFDPNFSFIYLFNNQSSIKGSVSMIHQFVHLASVGTVSLPTDVWLPSTNFIKPQQVLQMSSGYFRNFKNNTYETSVELYYKQLNNQVDFQNGVLDNFDNTKIESNVMLGSGIAYGAEFFLKKKVGNTIGWISYTLSKTLRKFEGINNNKYYPAKYDRVHDFSFTLNHKLNDRWALSAVFVYATGNALTLPAGRYIIQGNVANHYTDVNSFRMPAYHRLDVSANYKLKSRKRFESWLNFSIYNVYNRSNPYFIYFAIKGDLEHYYLSVAAKQISLFPILPSITWSFKF